MDSIWIRRIKQQSKKVISLSDREILLNSWIITASNKFHIDPNVLEIKNLSLTDNYEYFGSYSIYEKKLSLETKKLKNFKFR